MPENQPTKIQSKNPKTYVFWLKIVNLWQYLVSSNNNNNNNNNNNLLSVKVFSPVD